MDAAIRRLKEVNPQINAVVTFRLTRLGEKVDRLLKKKDPFVMNSPLAGVPCVVKECMEMPGMPYTAGVKSRMNQVGWTYATSSASDGRWHNYSRRNQHIGGMYVSRIEQHDIWFDT